MELINQLKSDNDKLKQEINSRKMNKFGCIKDQDNKKDNYFKAYKTAKMQKMQNHDQDQLNRNPRIETNTSIQRNIMKKKKSLDQLNISEFTYSLN